VHFYANDLSPAAKRRAVYFIWKLYVAMRLCGAKKKLFKYPKNVMENRYV
jgi:hypothetical protein